MRNVRVAALFLPVVLALYGCGTPGRITLDVTEGAFRDGGTPLTTALLRADSQRFAAPTGGSADEARVLATLRRDYQNVLATCRTVLSDYASKAADARQYAFGIAMVGTIAGAVVVPALTASASAAKSAIAGWGGLSGAANSAQGYLRDSGLAPQSVVAARETIRLEFRAAIQKYNAATTVAEKQVAIGELVSACTAYAVEGAQDITVPAADSTK